MVKEMANILITSFLYFFLKEIKVENKKFNLIQFSGFTPNIHNYIENNRTEKKNYK